MATRFDDHGLTRDELYEILDRLPYATTLTSESDGELLYVNRGFTTETGYTREEALGRRTLGLLWTDAGERERAVARLRDEGHVSNMRAWLLCADGRRRRFDLNAEWVTIGDERWILTTAWRIRDVEKPLARFREAEERYQAFVRRSLEGIVCYEFSVPVESSLPEEEQARRILEHGHIAECNDTFARMNGGDRAEDLIGVRVGRLLAASFRDPFRQALQFVRNGYRTDHFEIRREIRPGESRWFAGSSLGILENGRLTRVWSSRRDVTRSRHLEERLRQSQKLEAVGHLAGGVAHDFNNLLTVIAGFADLIEAHEGLPPDVVEAVREIRNANERGAELTRQLLAFGRRQVLQPVPLTLESVVEGMEPLLRRVIGDHILLRIDLARRPSVVVADRGQLEQVLMNLVLNARDAMPDGGSLDVRTSLADGRARLAVEDQGCGMDEQVARRAFEPFFTTKERSQGTGLGLATVYGIVEQSGGDVTIESVPGRGTRVVVELPLSADTVAPAERRDSEGAEGAESIEPPLTRGHEAILLVEDDAAIRRVIGNALRTRGYSVVDAGSGDEAWSLVGAARSPVDAVVTDIMMPGMSGIELGRRIRERHPEIPVIYMSGYATDTLGREARNDGDAEGIDFLQKPFGPEVLLGRLREVLARRPASDVSG